MIICINEDKELENFQKKKRNLIEKYKGRAEKLRKMKKDLQGIEKSITDIRLVPLYKKVKREEKVVQELYENILKINGKIEYLMYIIRKLK